jgi:hypothetical protein
MSKLDIVEHNSSSYAPRTFFNATSAELTVAFAMDMTTAGERLTHKAAANRYVGIVMTESPLQAARILYKALKSLNASILNVAGNGIYTLSSYAWDQKRTNQYVYDVLSVVTEYWPLHRVISGGQTGVDIAGIVAAYALGIEACATLPKGFIQRGANKIDVSRSASTILEEVKSQAAKLR